MRRSNLKSFSIKGLFADRDIKISFKDDVQILIGENGLGKTTVLSILYYTLTNKLYKLKEFDFTSLELHFTNKEKVFISKEILLKFDKDIDSYVPPSLTYALSKYSDHYLLNDIYKMLISDIPPYLLDERIEFLRNSIEPLRRYPRKMILIALKSVFGLGEGNEKIKNAKETIEKQLAEIEILYFPTFRRIEEDLINLGIEDEKTKINQGDTRLIQFGMKDVKQRFEDIKKEINNLSSKGLSQISSEILSQLVKGVPNINNDSLRNINKKDIDIILARVGEAISPDDKKKITEIISEKKFKEIDDKYLVYFLEKLITIYEKQRQIDNSIESFVSVCNKYLSFSNKEIIYEASGVEFYLTSSHSIDHKRVLLTEILGKLSSGEKQIISLFSKIYLSDSKSFIVLFDEPELSLSIFWQKLLLPDIYSSDKCKFLLSVTHSPFIFDNELEKNAIALSEYIKFKQ